MTKSELIDRLALRFPALTVADVKSCTNAVLEAISDSLARGDRAEIRDFGSFQLHYRPPRLGRNPRTGEKVEVPAKAAPHFKPGKELRQKVDF